VAKTNRHGQISINHLTANGNLIMPLRRQQHRAAEIRTVMPLKKVPSVSQTNAASGAEMQV